MILFAVAGHFAGPTLGVTSGAIIGLLVGLIVARFVPNRAACPVPPREAKDES